MLKRTAKNIVLWGYFFGESGSIEQNMDPTLNPLILVGKVILQVLIIFCSVFKVLCCSFLSCALDSTFRVCLKFNVLVDFDKYGFMEVFLGGKGWRGVEDTRLKAKVKAKDTNKIRGQGQPFRGQTLSRPRTGMLEAKDQGHKRKCSPKKKKRSPQKFFKRSSQKNVYQKIFQALHKILTNQKIVLSSSRGQANFRGLEASRQRTSKCVLKDSTSGKGFYT